MFIRILLAVTLLISLCPQEVWSQTTPAVASTNTAPAAPVPPAAIPLGDIVAQADLATARLAEMNARLASDAGLKAKNDKLAELSLVIAESVDDGVLLSQGSPTFSTLRSKKLKWEGQADDIAALNRGLTQSSNQLAAQVAQLAELTARWTATKNALKEGTKLSPPAPEIGKILKSIDDMLTAFSQTAKGTLALQAQIVDAQRQVSEQESKIKRALASLTSAQDRAVKNLFVSNSPPLWEIRSVASKGQATDASDGPLSLQLRALRLYAKSKSTTVGVLFGVFVFLAIMFFRLRVKARERAKTDPAWGHTAKIFDAPVATATILTLLAAWMIFNAEAPRILVAIIVAALLIPSVIILRRLIDSSLFSILYAMVGFNFIDQWRFVVETSPVWSRLILLVELIVAAVYLSWLIRTHRADVEKEPDSRLARGIMLYSRVAMIVFTLAGFAEILGYSQLATQVSNAMFESSYLAVIVYAAVLVLDGLTKTALKIWPLTELGSVGRHYLLLCRKFSRLFRWIAFAGWVTATLELFQIRAPLWAWLYSISFKTVTDAQGLHPHEDLTIFFGKPIAFGLIVWASFLVSRFIRFILNEEVFTHFNLAPGVPYAASTMVHYGILVLGFFACINVVDAVSEFAILAGAFSVGLGFGLQNIMNNFVSGIILLFERPIKLGDVIQLGTDVGVVDRIGIRASVIRLDNGAEIIVPNGNLISAQVTNWTLSSRERIIEIPVTVSPKADFSKVIELLKEVAKTNPRVMSDPPPEVLLLSFTTTAMNFQLRVWIDSFDQWMKVRSELSLAITEALAKENIALG